MVLTSPLHFKLFKCEISGSIRYRFCVCPLSQMDISSAPDFLVFSCHLIDNKATSLELTIHLFSNKFIHGISVGDIS